MADMEPIEESIAETENYEAWYTQDGSDGEVIYHLDTGRATLHFFQEEWDELCALFEQVNDK